MRKIVPTLMMSLVWVKIPGGTFSMGCTGCDMPDALPVHEVQLDAFFITETPITNKDFKAFVRATSYVTTAEKPLDPTEFPGVPKENLKAGSTLFKTPKVFKGLNDPLSWWEFKVGASWRRPTGTLGETPDDSLPVVHVSYHDAKAYCAFKKSRLPTEAEFEYAARGGLKNKKYAWGDQFKPGGKWQSNTWQGSFPMVNNKADGYLRLAPVKAFPKNGYGLYGMGGNVWQWTSDWYRPDYFKQSPRKNPQGPKNSFDPDEPGVPKKVQKGGSYLCSPEYCQRYFVGSRGKGELNTGSGHVGFRCARSL